MRWQGFKGGIRAVNKTGPAFTCPVDYASATRQGEVGASQAILSAGYNVAVMETVLVWGGLPHTAGPVHVTIRWIGNPSALGVPLDRMKGKTEHVPYSALGRCVCEGEGEVEASTRRYRLGHCSVGGLGRANSPMAEKPQQKPHTQTRFPTLKDHRHAHTVSGHPTPRHSLYRMLFFSLFPFLNCCIERGGIRSITGW